VGAGVEELGGAGVVNGRGRKGSGGCVTDGGVAFGKMTEGVREGGRR